MSRAALLIASVCLGGLLTYAWAQSSEWQPLPAQGRGVQWLRV